MEKETRRKFSFLHDETKSRSTLFSSKNKRKKKRKKRVRAPKSSSCPSFFKNREDCSFPPLIWGIPKSPNVSVVADDEKTEEKRDETETPTEESDKPNEELITEEEKNPEEGEKEEEERREEEEGEAETVVTEIVEKEEGAGEEEEEVKPSIVITEEEEEDEGQIIKEWPVGIPWEHLGIEEEEEKLFDDVRTFATVV